MFKKYIEVTQPTVIFVSEKQKTFVERKLLEEVPAYFHIQVTTIEHYVVDLLKKNHLFNYSLLSKKTSLLALKACLEIEGLVYFKQEKKSEGLLNALLEAFELMSNYSLDIFPDDGKWMDLKRMYKAFCDYKKEECFLSELLYKALPYVPQDVMFVDLSYQPYSLALETFFRKCRVEKIELEENRHTTSFYQVQYPHQEIELCIRQISEGLYQGNRYMDHLVYVPSHDWLVDFIAKCPYPCSQEFVCMNNRDYAFMEAFYAYDVDQMKRLAYLEDAWFSNLIQGSNACRKQLLEEVVSIEIEDLPEELSFEEYRLFLKMILKNQTLQASELLDCINVVTYDTPIVVHNFKQVFCLGMNEDLFPSKVSESALILDDELGDDHPLLKNAKRQWDMMEDCMKMSRDYVCSCHFSTLVGEDVLPSLLYKSLLGQQKEKQASFTIPVEESTFDGQVEPLQDASAFYKKEGVSPSELETFNACPYKHFLSYGLKIRPIKRKLETKAKFGTLMHDMLDACAMLFQGNFYDQLETLEKKYHLTQKDLLDERLSDLAEALLETFSFSVEDPEDTYLYKQFPTQFLNTLKILLYHLESGEFKMAFHEDEFTYRHENVLFKGRIDRGDVYKDYLKIMDYKSSNKTFDLAMALEGFNVQMAMYLEMLSKNKQLKKGALLYFNTSKRKIASKGTMNLDGTTVNDFEKAYQMEGWILEDSMHDVMYGIDHNFPESNIAHIKYSKKNDAYQGRLLSEEQLERLIDAIFKHLHQLVERCFEKGDISIYPAGSDELATQMKVSPCQYCDYQDVCLRDPFYHDQRKIQLMNKEEMDEFLKGGKDNGQSDKHE